MLLQRLNMRSKISTCSMVGGRCKPPELAFFAQIVEEVIEAGATVINLPDTVGYATPQNMDKCLDI